MNLCLFGSHIHFSPDLQTHEHQSRQVSVFYVVSQLYIKFHMDTLTLHNYYITIYYIDIDQQFDVMYTTDCSSSLSEIHLLRDSLIKSSQIWDFFHKN